MKLRFIMFLIKVLLQIVKVNHISVPPRHHPTISNPPIHSNKHPPTLWRNPSTKPPPPNNPNNNDNKKAPATPRIPNRARQTAHLLQPIPRLHLSLGLSKGAPPRRLAAPRTARATLKKKKSAGAFSGACPPCIINQKRARLSL